MTRCYKISAKGNFSKEMFFRSQWVVAFGKSWTLKYKVNSLIFIWHTSPFSALHIFRKSWREKSNKRQEKIKSMELVGYSVIQHTVLKITSFTKHLFDLRSSRDTFEEYLSGWLPKSFTSQKSKHVAHCNHIFYWIIQKYTVYSANPLLIVQKPTWNWLGLTAGQFNVIIDIILNERYKVVTALTWHLLWCPFKATAKVSCRKFSSRNISWMNFATWIYVANSANIGILF